MSNCRNTETAAILAFFAGAALAGAAAVLLTPKSGREMRETLGDVTDDAVGKIKAAVKDAKFKIGATRSKDDATCDIEGGSCWI